MGKPSTGHKSYTLEAYVTPNTVKKHRLSFDDLLGLHDELDVKLMNGGIRVADYESEWREFLDVAGWTQAEFERELDRRWDIDLSRPVPPARSVS